MGKSRDTRNADLIDLRPMLAMHSSEFGHSDLSP
jgi:hypothetical protein